MKYDRYVCLQKCVTKVTRKRDYFYSMEKTYHTVKVPCPGHCSGCEVKEFCEYARRAYERLSSNS